MLPIATPALLTSQIPLNPKAKGLVDSFRQDCINILTNKNERLLLICGPCSIHDPESAYEYAKRLFCLSSEVKDVFMIVMRTYFEKSRTSSGWKGFISDPDLDGSYDIASGLYKSRKLLSDITDLGLATATEFLDPITAPYISDFISWGSIGARTSQSPIHRQLATDLEMPIGFKNRTDGNIDVAIQGCSVAKNPSHFLSIDKTGKVCKIISKGNIHPHIVLRGGEMGPNYSYECVQNAKELLEMAALTPTLIVDCSHDNSRKNPYAQSDVFFDLIQQITATNSPIRGMMLESFWENSSFTDPCLDWNQTEQLIREGAKLLREKVRNTCALYS
jgi:3-deoxy-7-phosphoheptulonate synthase